MPLRPHVRTLLPARALIALVALAALVVSPVAGARPDGSPKRIDIVVGFKDAASAAKRAAALTEAGVRVEERLPKLDAVVVNARAADVPAVLRELRADRAVEYAAREGGRRALLAPNDPGYTSIGWPYPQLTLPNAWDLGTGQASVVVAVLDTGVDATHPDLPALAAGYDFANEDANPADDHGHGTTVVGAFGARVNNGVGAAGACPGCTVMPVKVLDAQGFGADADIAEGLVWATDHGAKVINLSLGGESTSDILEYGVKYALERGVVLIAASGNEGTEEELYPASHDGVIGVAGTDSAGRIHDSSNRGLHLELAAPFCFYTTALGGGYGEACGTSIAAPIVSGVAGLMLSQNAGLNKTQIEDVLTSTANGELGLDVEDGLVDAYRAVLTAGSMPAVPVNSSLPLITGALAEGETLAASAGTWTNAPSAYTYQWQRCNAVSVSCGPIDGADTATYVVSAPDVAKRLRVVVTATNHAGSTNATSAVTDVISGDAPLPGVNDLYTTISASTASPTVGSSVVYRIGVAHRQGSPAAPKVSLAFTMPSGMTHVESTANRGPGCTLTGQTVACDLGYLPRTAEAELVVTATVAMTGMLTVLAAATPTPDDAKPNDNLVTHSVTVPGPPAPASSGGQDEDDLPSVTITGDAKVGALLTADPGPSWKGRGPHTFGYQWEACATLKGKLECTTLAGQTKSTLAVTRAHVGKRLRVVVVALSADGIGELRDSSTTAAVRR
jgi:subtilisin family serine protease